MRVEDHPECHSHVQLEKPGGFLSQEYSGLSPLDFEENLKAQGWLSWLEQSGVFHLRQIHKHGRAFCDNSILGQY